MKTPLIILSIILTCGIIFTLTACTTKTNKDKDNNYYLVDYCGQKGCYTNAKDKYKAGSKVTLYYDLIATDTDYKFTLDGESVNWTSNEKGLFTIEFIMPDHDVKLECHTKNSMEPYIPE